MVFQELVEFANLMVVISDFFTAVVIQCIYFYLQNLFRHLSCLPEEIPQIPKCFGDNCDKVHPANSLKLLELQTGQLELSGHQIFAMRLFLFLGIKKQKSIKRLC